MDVDERYEIYSYNIEDKACVIDIKINRMGYINQSYWPSIPLYEIMSDNDINDGNGLIKEILCFSLYNFIDNECKCKLN